MKPLLKVMVKSLLYMTAFIALMVAWEQLAKRFKFLDIRIGAPMVQGGVL
jgi:hypothetical protein